MDEVTLKVVGMSCGGCVTSVEKAASRVNGVEGVQVDLKGGTAKVRGRNLEVVRLVAAIEDAGYDASPA
jgi:copper chaperone